MTYFYHYFLLLSLFFAAINQSGCMRQSALQTALEPIRTQEQWDDCVARGLVPKNIEHVYCSGGTLRLIVYLNAADKVVAVDTNERKSDQRTAMKAYLAAHPEFHDMPIGGETSGRDNPELLLSLKPPPQLIIKADTGAGYDPIELTRRTGIPVLLVPMRGITVGREEFDAGLRLIGKAINESERAETVIRFFDDEMADIKRRAESANTASQTNVSLTNASQIRKPLVYVGGVSYNGSHGFHSSEAGYPPFEIAGAKSPLQANENDPVLGKRHTMLAKEKILEWDPDILFLDLGTLYLGSESGLYELRNDPAYQSLTAVQQDRVYTLMPNTFYFVNHDAVLANAWFVGKTLYPDQFQDVDPKKKADEIFEFLVGKPVFEKLNFGLDRLAFEKLMLKKTQTAIR